MSTDLATLLAAGRLLLWLVAFGLLVVVARRGWAQYQPRSRGQTLNDSAAARAVHDNRMRGVW